MTIILRLIKQDNHTHADDVDEIVVAKCVQDLFNGVFGYLDVESSHAAAHVD